MNNKRAAAYELREKKTAEYKQQILTLIARVNLNPFEVDYSAELEAIHSKNPKDKALILDAERQAYRSLKK